MKKLGMILCFLACVFLAAYLLTCNTNIDDEEKDYFRPITPVKVNPPAPDPTAPEGQLIVVGNKIYNMRTAEEVRLTGANAYEYDIIADWKRLGSSGSRLEMSIDALFDIWHGNVVRLPLEVNNSEIYGGHGQKMPQGNYPEYIEAIKYFVSVAERHKKYIILDLHTYVMLTERCMAFWREWIQVPELVNNPYVLFGLLNEPLAVSWETWRNGGSEMGDYRYGYQQLIEMIRDAGAKNIVLTAGLDWGYDLRGVVGEAPSDRKVYALVDQGSGGDKSKTGYGIIYESHIYPWKGMEEWYAAGSPPGKTMEFCYNDWIDKIGTIRKIAPVLIGECGWQFTDVAFILSTIPDFDDQDKRNAMMEAEFAPGKAAHHTNWMPALLEFFDDEKTYGSRLHYTAWCFSMLSSPILLTKAGWQTGHDPNNYDGYDPETATRRMNLLNSAANSLTPEQRIDLFTPNDFSGIYFYEHMRAYAELRGEDVGPQLYFRSQE